MANWGKSHSEKASSNGFWGIVGLAVGGLFLVQSGIEKSKARQEQEIRAGVGPWEELKKSNRELYYKCLDEVSK